MTDHDRAWLTNTIQEHLITADETTDWVPVAAVQHINNQKETT